MLVIVKDSFRKESPMKYFSILVLCLLASCGRPSKLVFNERLTEEVAAEETPFETLKAQVLIPHCLKCHSKKSTEESLASWIDPGSPETSRLYKSVKTGSMPKKAAALGTKELEIIRAYIMSLASEVTFDELKAEILAPSCLRCHKKMDSAENLEKWIDREKPEASKLYVRVKDGTMPKNGAPLSDPQMQMILGYIKSPKLTQLEKTIEDHQ